jgi:hypothetical protein
MAAPQFGVSPWRPVCWLQGSRRHIMYPVCAALDSSRWVCESILLQGRACCGLCLLHCRLGLNWAEQYCGTEAARVCGVQLGDMWAQHLRGFWYIG